MRGAAVGGVLLIGAALLLLLRSDPPGAPGLPKASSIRAAVPPAVQTVREASSAPADLPEPVRYQDGRSARRAYWASDEVHVVHTPAADTSSLLPSARTLYRNEKEFTARVEAVDRAGFARRAAALEAMKGVLEARPVFYATAEAYARRGVEGRRILTRQVAVSLPAGGDVRALADRHGARVVRPVASRADTFVLEAPSGFEALALAETLRDGERLGFAAPQFARLHTPKGRFIPTDTLFGDQWHLRNTGQFGGTAGEDVRAYLAWDTTKGAGIVIGIIDDGLQHTHPDLLPNYSPSLSIDIFGGDSDPAPAAGNNHGTAVSGVAAARGENAIGVVGAAYLAQLAGIRLTAGFTTDADEEAAMSHQNPQIRVKNNSWGPSDDGATLEGPGPLTAGAVAAGAGAGVVYVWAAGNGLQSRDDANFDGYANNRHVIGVAAVDLNGIQSPYSEPGASILITAPSSGTSIGISTTDRTGNQGYNAASTPSDYTDKDYTDSFGGTSSAAPLASGVVALILSANPNLSARDVKHILVRTSRKNDSGDSGWTPNGANFDFNHKYGRGVPDAGAAVTLAKRWPYAPAEASLEASSSPNVAIPDSPDATTPGTPGPAVSDTITLPAAPALRAEFVEVVFDATHPARGDLRVRLTSPDGTESILADWRDADQNADFPNWVFTTVRCWGESPAGTWTLTVDDNWGSLIGTFNSWTVRVFGTVVDASAPVGGAVNDGPAADIDVQASTSQIDANWSGFSDPQSGIVYEWAIGTTGNPESVQPFSSTGYLTSASATGLALTVGTTYFVTVRATNFDGLQTSSTSDGVLIQPDTTPPATPAAPDLHPLSDTGASATDDLTNDTTPTFSGTTEAGATVELFDGAVSLGTVTADGAGAYAITAPALGSGTHLLSVIATDAAGNPSGSSPTLSIEIDTAAPAPPASAPDLDAASDSAVTTDNVTNDATPTFNGTAAAGAAVTIYAGAVAVGSGVADGGGAYSITTSSLGNALHTVTATAMDAAGNESAPSAGLSVTIDTLPPAPPSAPDLDPGSDSAIPTDNITSDASPSFSGTAEANSSILLFVGAVQVGAATAGAGGAYAVTSSARPDGTFAFTARAIDAAGNTSGLSSGLSVTIDTSIAVPGTPDLQASSDTGTSSTDNITADTTPTFTGTAEPNAGIELFAGAISVGSASADGAGAFSVTSSALAAAVYLFKVRATDAAGNISGDSPTLQVTIDTSTPAQPAAPDLAAASDSGNPADNLTNDTTPTFTGTVGANSTVKLYAGAVEVGSVVSDGAGAYSVTSSARPPGVHAFSVTETNTVGNTSPASPALSVTLDTAVATPGAPDLDAASDTGASPSDNVTSDATPTFTGSTEAGATVDLLVGVAVVASISADGAGAYSVTAPAQADGTRTFTVRATDGAGNVSAVSPGLAVTFDGSVPVSGSVNDGLGADIDSQVSMTTISANWSGFSDAQSGLDRYFWAIGLAPDGEEVLAFADVGLGLNATQGGLSLSNGVTYFVTVRAVDVAGLQTTAASNGVTVNAPTPPAITSTQVINASAGVPYAYDVNATGSPSATYSLSVAPGGMSIHPATGVISWLPTQAQIGPHSVTVVAANGVPPDASQSYTVTVAASPSGGPPVASAGADATGNPGGYVLDGSGSTDPEAGTITYLWTEDGGNPALNRLKNATSSTAIFMGAAPGVYVFQLRVTDPTGLQGIDAVTVTILDVAPVADAGPDAAVALGAAVALDGRGSTDGNGTALTFLWTESPSNPSSGTLSNAGTSTPTFTAGVAGTYLLTLQVGDGVSSDTDTVRIDVLKLTAPLVVPPVADAGADRTVFLPSTVQLSGAGSVDADDPSGVLSFSWTEEAGNPATGLLSSATVASPTFTPVLPGAYAFRLVVTDSADDNLPSAPDSVTVWVNAPANVQPAASASSTFNDLDLDGLVDPGETVTLSAAASVDPEGGALTFTWTQVGGPAVTTVSSGSTSSFTPALPGTYVFQISANDGASSSPPIFVTVQVVSSGAGAPVAAARANGTAGLLRLTVLPGDPPVALGGNLSVDNDGDGFPLAFRWERTKGPMVAVSGSDSAAASFSPLLAGTYVFRLKVTDSNGLWDVDQVTVIVDTFDGTLNPTGNGVPTAVLQLVPDVPAGTVVTLDGTASSDPVDADAVTNASNGLVFTFAQRGGPAAAIVPGAAGTATVTPLTPGIYSFELVVSDGASQSSPAIVSFSVTSPAPPAPASKRKRKRCGALGLEFLLPVGAVWLWRRRRR